MAYRGGETRGEEHREDLTKFSVSGREPWRGAEPLFKHRTFFKGCSFGQSVYHHTMNTENIATRPGAN